MIQIIRGIITDFIQGVYNTFYATGRPDETLKGTQYQHYGFSSFPPVGAEVICLQYGQNNISIAETGGDISPGGMSPGDVALYTDGAAATESTLKLHKDASTGDRSISVTCKDGIVNIFVGSGLGKVVISGPNVEIGDQFDTTNFLSLLTEKFKDNVYALHTHPYVNGTTPATTSAATPITEPLELTSQLTAK